jgi:hypothetical protein
VRCLIAASALLAGLGSAEAAVQCDAVEIPDQLDLACRAAVDGAGIVIEPVSNEFASLSRMTITELARDEDPLAWTDPETWLRDQLSIDTSGLSGAVDDLADSPDSPFTGSVAESMLGSVAGFLDGLGSVALSGCEEPEHRREERWSMPCRFEAAGLGVYILERLEIEGERRWGVMIRTMNEQRLRHFEAIANSFSPAAG